MLMDIMDKLYEAFDGISINSGYHTDIQMVVKGKLISRDRAVADWRSGYCCIGLPSEVLKEVNDNGISEFRTASFPIYASMDDVTMHTAFQLRQDLHTAIRRCPKFLSHVNDISAIQDMRIMSTQMADASDMRDEVVPNEFAEYMAIEILLEIEVDYEETYDEALL